MVLRFVRTSVLRGLAVILFGICLPLLGGAGGIEKLPEIAKLPLIRIGVTEAPQFGHQAAAANVVSRLRQLGYEGQIQVVYDYTVKAKLSSIFPPFRAEGSDVQVFHEQKITFVDRNTFQFLAPTFPQVELGILGADDNKTRPEELRVHALLTLQHWNWSEAASLQVATDSREQHQRRQWAVEAIEDRPHFYEIPNPTDGEKFITENMAHAAALAGKIAGLQTLNRARAHAEIAAAYGHYFRGAQAAPYALGLLRAMRARPHLFTRGAIVPIFNTLIEHASETVLQTIAKENPEAKTQVQFVDLQDPQLAERCARVRPGEILFVKAGPVSKPVFEYFYRLSTLPPVVEGLNSLNMAHLLGMPYLPSSSHEGYQVEGVPEVAQAAFAALTSLTYQRGPEDLKKLERFFIEAKEPYSDLNVFFISARPEAAHTGRDKIYGGLELAEKALLERRPGDDSCADILRRR